MAIKTHHSFILIASVFLFAAFLPTASATEAEKAGPVAYLPESHFPELATILETARTAATDMEIQSILEDEADARLGQARAQGLPNANIYVQTGPRQDFRSGDVEDNSYFGVNAGLRVSQPLYHWGAIKAEIERASLAADDAALARSGQETELIRQLRSDYLSLLLNQRLRTKEASRLELAEADVKRLKIEFDSGKLPEIDLRDEQLQAEQVRLSISRMQAYEIVLRDRFRQKYGFAGEVEADGALPELDVTAALNWVEQEKAALNSSRVYDFIPVQRQLGLIEQQDAYLEIVEANHRPKFNLFASATQGITNTATENDVNTISLMVGLSMNWNLFDGYRTREQKIEARLKKNRLKLGLDRQVDALQAQQARMLKTLELRLREYDIMEQSLAVRQARHRTAEINFNDGRITEADYEEAALRLDNVEAERNQALVEVLTGFSDYDCFTRLVTEK